MTGNTFTNVSNPVDDHDAANKVYVDENIGISKNGDTMLGDLNMNNFRLTGLPTTVPETGSGAVSWAHAVQLVRDSERDCVVLKVNRSGDIMTDNLMISAAGNNDRLLGCTDLDTNQKFSIPLGTSTNQLSFTHRQNPVLLDTDYGFMVKAGNNLVCQLGTSDNPPPVSYTHLTLPTIYSV